MSATRSPSCLASTVSSSESESFLRSQVTCVAPYGEPPVVAIGVHAQGVDDGEQAPGQAPLDHQVEHIEGVGAGALVVLVLPDHGPQVIRRHHLAGAEPSLRQRRRRLIEGAT